MLHEVKLIFGYDSYYGCLEVSPKAMLALLQRPFAQWLYSIHWETSDVDGWSDKKFHQHVFESTSYLNDEDFYFDPKNAEWIGFRVSLEQKDAEVEFIFTTETINGQIRQNLDVLSKNITQRLITTKSILNDVLSDVMRNDLKPVNQKKAEWIMVETLGERLRRKRKEKNLGLRETAGKVDVSPTFLSRIENENEPPMPSEKVIRALAHLLDDDFDTIMQLAGRVPTDIAQMIKSDPEMPAFLRSAQSSGFSAGELMNMLTLNHEDSKQGKK